MKQYLRYMLDKHTQDDNENVVVTLNEGKDKLTLERIDYNLIKLVHKKANLIFKDTEEVYHIKL